MSRAGYIWIVLDGYTEALRAAFTVKHECAGWLERRPAELVAVCRMRDGHHHPDSQPVWLDRETLEPIKIEQEEES
jgi:hypothetical protein